MTLDQAQIPILLDTDIGSDIDDAVALAYLLRQPRCRLMGITTVTGEPERRASLASAICRAAGREDVPIHVGVGPPFLIAPHQPKATQAEALSEQWPHALYTAENTAVTFLRDTIRAHPGEITLLAVGPLTNIALLFMLYPDIPALLNRLVMMGGVYLCHGDEGSTAEWNILCDPHAAARVFKEPVPELTAVGLDVTLQCRLPADVCRERFAKAGGPLAPTAAMAEVWFKHSPVITFHDPLAAALIFQPDLCKTKAVQIEVDLHSLLAPSQTLMRRGETSRPPHQIATEVNVEAFFAHYFEVVGG